MGPTFLPKGESPGAGSALRATVAGFGVMAQTLFALILREARVRHGRSRLGYAWAVVEPILIVAVIILVVSGLIGRRELSYDFAIFYALGVINFQYYRHATGFVAHAIEANQPLFNYPAVHEVDAALARWMLDTATYVIIGAATFVFLWAFFGATRPAHPERMILAYLGLGLLALGIGLNLAACLRRYYMTMQVWALLTAPQFVFSAVIYSVEGLPTAYRDILLWNPVVHGVEGMRSGYYPDYGRDYVSFGYLYLWALGLLASGLFMVLLTRRGMK